MASSALEDGPHGGAFAPETACLTLACCLAGGTLYELVRHFVGGAADFSQRTELCRMMTAAGSDKGADHHNYTLVYDVLFSGKRQDIARLLEVGIGTNYTDVPSNMGAEGRPGASLRAWRDYFPKASVFGADIDTRVLFREPRIETRFVDQLSPGAIADMWNAIGLSDFDVIIDDGLHSFEANWVFFENSIRHLKPGGVFIIEDILCTRGNIEAFDGFLHATGYEFALIVLPHAKNKADNALAIIQKNERAAGTGIAFNRDFYSGIDTLQEQFRRREAAGDGKPVKPSMPQALLSMLTGKRNP